MAGPVPKVRLIPTERSTLIVVYQTREAVEAVEDSLKPLVPEAKAATAVMALSSSDMLIQVPSNG